ncbi:MAG: 50S ribosomal protein L29 [Patescibacteria group bacterium]
MKELREKNIDELQKSLVSAREQVRDLRFKIGTKQLPRVRQLREARKEVVRILTVLNEKRHDQHK